MRRIWFRGGALGACAVFFSLASVAVAASPAIYWTGYRVDAIGRANLDGSDVQPRFIATGDAPAGVAVNGSHIYWSNNYSNTIGRADLDGTHVNQTWIRARTPTGLAVANGQLYWDNQGTWTIGRANLDGTGVDQQFLPAKSPGGVAADASHVYWTNYDTDTIGRANLDGTGAQQAFIAGARYPFGLAVSEPAPAGAAHGSHRRHLARGRGRPAGSGPSLDRCREFEASGRSARVAASSRREQSLADTGGMGPLSVSKSPRLRRLKSDP